MKRLVLVPAVLALVMPSPALAFHHRFLPAPTCASDNSGGNAGGANPTAVGALREAGLIPPALPPSGTPGEDNASSTPAESNCANA